MKKMRFETFRLSKSASITREYMCAIPTTKTELFYIEKQDQTLRGKQPQRQ